MVTSDMMNRIDLRFDFVAEKLKSYTVDETTGCWNWTGKIKKSRGGYGQMLIYCNDLTPKKRIFAAHRVSYAYHTGEDPGRLCVMHTCDNPACINPDHLRLGTHADNMKDMASKGRSTVGESNPRSVLTESVVEQIVYQIECGKSNTEIASELPVSHSMISLIRQGKCWRPFTESLGYEPEKHKKFSRSAA